MEPEKAFQLTYATMFNPPEELHTRYAQALEKVKTTLGREYPMMIGGKPVFSEQKLENHSPINTDMLLGVFQKGSAEHGRAAMEAAQKAFPAWSRTPWQERVALLRKAAALLDERLFEIGAAMTLEVGKNRMEALGDVSETADLIRYACSQMEANLGYIVQMGNDPLSGFHSTNVSVMRSYGVWVVISPFNFPGALTGGPAGAALVTGNTVVIKPASDTSWMPCLLSQCFHDAGIPDGVVNFVTGSGSIIGQALIDSPLTAGLTFTGSYGVGMNIYRSFAAGKWVRPLVLELGGKNAVIVSRHANLEDAATGIIRSAFGLQGQKCSACSRILIEDAVYDDLVARLVEGTRKLVLGDPTERQVYLGPVINKAAYRDYQTFCEDLSQNGRILTGGKIITDGPLAKGYFCQPTLVENLSYEHPLWKQEMFLPISTIGRIRNLEEGMTLANSVDYGLTAGFYGGEDEIAWYQDHIEAGVTYVNRPQGATTGAWPGFQPFGGWKGSGSTGKNAGGVYYLSLYMREQILNRVRRGN